MAKITIIGAGELGRALGQVLGAVVIEGLSHQVSYWDKDEARLAQVSESPVSLPEAMAEADFVFLCVPSWQLKEALAFLQPYWFSSATAVIWSKGFDGPTRKLPHEIAHKLLPPKVAWALVSGAMMAEEIVLGRRGAALVVGSSLTTAHKVAGLFLGSNIAIRVSDDLLGVAWSGVLKNIYGLGLGLADGFNLTINERALIFARSQEEASRLIKLLGGRPATWSSPEIMADFLATSFDRQSLNHEVGLALAQSGSCDKPSEGVMSLAPLLAQWPELEPKKFPILFQLAEIVLHQADPKNYLTIF